MLKAIIFDCDGVIADTEPLHLATFQTVLEEEGIELTAEQYYRDYLALDDRGCFSRLYLDRGVSLSADRLSDLIARKAACLDPIMRKSLRVFPGVVDFVREAAGRYPLAIASGALSREVALVLETAGIADCFQAIIAAEDVAKGKPDPEPFLKACAALSATQAHDLRPADCLAVEDSIHGIEAARNAGMRCLAVTNSYPRIRLSEADLVIDSFTDLPLSDLERLFTETQSFGNRMDTRPLPADAEKPNL